MPRKKKEAPPRFTLQIYEVELYAIDETHLMEKRHGLAYTARDAMRDAERIANQEMAKGASKKELRKLPALEARAATMLGPVEFAPQDPEFSDI
jgi:arginyl-tRNA synthetase